MTKYVEEFKLERELMPLLKIGLELETPQCTNICSHVRSERP